MRPILLIYIALLCSCATTPQETIERGERFEFMSDQAPPQAAACLARRAEERAGLHTALREAVAAGTMEVVVRVSGGDGAWVVIHALPRTGGSAIVVWLAPRLVSSRNFVEFLQEAGC